MIVHACVCVCVINSVVAHLYYFCGSPLLWFCLRFQLLRCLSCDFPSCDSYNGISPMVTSLSALPSMYIWLLRLLLLLRFCGFTLASSIMVLTVGPCFAPSPTVTPSQVCTILFNSIQCLDFILCVSPFGYSSFG